MKTNGKPILVIGGGIAGMTAAAISSLLICREQMVLLGQPISPAMDASIQKAEAVLSKNFDPRKNRYGSSSPVMPSYVPAGTTSV